MKTSNKSVARFLPLLAILALPSLALWSCSGVGDAPGPPTGPATQYNPATDLPGATIVVTATSNASPGGEFDLIAAFTNGAGLPVQGVPLWASAESALYGSAVYFGFATNPTLTSENGKASIHVYVSPTCPQGSYSLIVQCFPADEGGPTAIGYTGIMVEGTGPEFITTPSAPVGNITPPPATLQTYLARGSESNVGHQIQYSFSWGDGFVTEWVDADTSNEASAAHDFNPSCATGLPVHTETFTYEITTKARCKIDTAIVSLTSPSLKVTVSKSCP